MIRRPAWASLRAASRLALRDADLVVEGVEHVPRHGPAVLAARHYHHFYDGCALLLATPRPLRAVVTLDWLRGQPAGFRAMVAACAAADWPVVPRNPPCVPNRPEQQAQLLHATRDAVRILRGGGVLLVFPEGYPTIDPGWTPKTSDDDYLPFQTGFARFALMAEQDGASRVTVVPVGLDYSGFAVRRRVVVRFGPARLLGPDDRPIDVAAHCAAVVRSLSSPSGVGLG